MARRFPVILVGMLGLTAAAAGTYRYMELHPPSLHEPARIMLPIKPGVDLDAVPNPMEAAAACIANLDALYPQLRATYDLPRMCACAAQEIMRLHLTRRELAKPMDDPGLAPLNAVCAERSRLRT